MKTHSAKAKGRFLQDKVRDTFRFIFKNKGLEDADIKSAIMGTSGCDIVLSPAAKRLIIFDIEVKNQEKLNINEALKQAESNSTKNRIPLLVFHKNHGKVYCALEFDSLIELLYNSKENNEDGLIYPQKSVIFNGNELQEVLIQLEKIKQNLIKASKEA